MNKLSLIHYIQEQLTKKTGSPNLFEIRIASLAFTSHGDKIEIIMYMYQSQIMTKEYFIAYKVFINNQTTEKFEIIEKNGLKFFVSEDLFQFYSSKIIMLLKEFC